MDPQPAALRRAFRRAALRWHPDRFQQRVALRLPTHERGAAAARVAALARQVGCLPMNSRSWMTRGVIHHHHA